MPLPAAPTIPSPPPPPPPPALMADKAGENGVVDAGLRSQHHCMSSMLPLSWGSQLAGETTCVIAWLSHPSAAPVAAGQRWALSFGPPGYRTRSQPRRPCLVNVQESHIADANPQTGERFQDGGILYGSACCPSCDGRHLTSRSSRPSCARLRLTATLPLRPTSAPTRFS